jgi:hypothetical protein
MSLATGTWASGEGEETLYTISSWDIPHGFVAFRVCRTPALVVCKNGKIRKHDYLPQIHNFLSGSTGLRITGRI